MVYIALTPNADWNNLFDAALHCHKQRVIILKECIPTGVILKLVSHTDQSLVHYCFLITLRTYQPQSTLIVFYLLEKVLSPSDFSFKLHQYLIGPNGGW